MSLDLRERVLLAVKEGMSCRQASLRRARSGGGRWNARKATRSRRVWAIGARIEAHAPLILSLCRGDAGHHAGGASGGGC